MPEFASRGRRQGKFGLCTNADKASSLRGKLSAQSGLAVRRETKQTDGLFIFPSALVLFSRKACFPVQVLISHLLQASSRLPSSLCRGGFREHQPSTEGLGEGRAPQGQGTEPPFSYHSLSSPKAGSDPIERYPQVLCVCLLSLQSALSQDASVLGSP